MPDRDLITEGHALLEAAGWDPTHDRLTLRDGALWVERPNGSADGLTEQLPPWAGYLGELIVWAVNSAPRLLDIVDEARKRLEGHEKAVERLTQERDTVAIQALAAHRRIAELEGETSPPVGHVVALFEEGHEPVIYGGQRVMSVADAIRSVGRSDLPRGVTLKLCELREVSDDV